MSTQVLQEFFVHAVHKLRLPPSQARSLVQVLSRRRTIQVNASLTLRAIDTSEQYRISFWDGAIIEAAVEGGCWVRLHGGRVSRPEHSRRSHPQSLSDLNAGVVLLQVVTSKGPKPNGECLDECIVPAAAKPQSNWRLLNVESY